MTTQTAVDHGRGASSGPFAEYGARFFRDDVQGVRAISALMIAVYHIWLNGVSGGVDVFFVISGFLVTTTLLKQLARGGRVSPLGFWIRLAWRIFPSAYLVLGGTVLLTLLFVPVTLWKFGVNELIASAAHIENLELMRQSTSYLDREDPPSPFQQFWALSLQMQFYVVLPFLVMLGAWLSRRARRVWPLAAILGVLISLSLWYSTHLTAASPATAYFHPGTRAWEFLSGSLVALAYPHLRAVGGAARRVWEVLALLALILLLGLGLVLGRTADFPGLVSLLPVGAAVVLLVASPLTEGRSWVNRGLAWRPLVYLGSFSFTVYLWHWPVLIVAQHLLGTTRLGLLEGLAVILVSVALAAMTKTFVEEPAVKARNSASLALWKQYAALGGVAVLVLSAGVGARQGLIAYADRKVAEGPTHTVAAPLTLQDEVDISFTEWLTLNYNRPRGIAECFSGRCVGGDPDADRTVLLVGASHSAQMFDVLDVMGQERGFKLVARLREPIPPAFAEESPDVVVDMGSRTSQHGESETFEREKLDAWQEIAEQTDLVLIRDNPRFGSDQNTCLHQNQNDPQECAVSRADLFQPSNPAEQPLGENPRVHLVDMTELWCEGDVCPVVDENIPMYYDRHHFTRSYLESASEMLADELGRQAPVLVGE